MCIFIAFCELNFSKILNSNFFRKKSSEICLLQKELIEIKPFFPGALTLFCQKFSIFKRTQALLSQISFLTKWKKHRKSSCIKDLTPYKSFCSWSFAISFHFSYAMHKVLIAVKPFCIENNLIILSSQKYPNYHLKYD